MAVTADQVQAAEAGLEAMLGMVVMVAALALRAPQVRAAVVAVEHAKVLFPVTSVVAEEVVAWVCTAKAPTAQAGQLFPLAAAAGLVEVTAAMDHSTLTDVALTTQLLVLPVCTAQAVAIVVAVERRAHAAQSASFGVLAAHAAPRLSHLQT